MVRNRMCVIINPYKWEVAYGLWIGTYSGDLGWPRTA